MSRRPPVDQPARDAISHQLDRVLFVEAGAGSGKTAALVSRVVELIAQGVASLDQIAAITFTESAAAELRERIHAALVDAAVDEVRTREQAERCTVAAHDIDHAAISTLHAFAARLLGDHPIEAGLPPQVEVLDEVQSSLAFELRWGRFLHALRADPDLRTIVLAARLCGITDAKLRNLAEWFDDNHDRLEGLTWPRTEPLHVDLSPLIDALDRALDSRSWCESDDDLLLAHLDGLEPYLERLRAAPDELDRLEVVFDGTKLSCTKGQKPNWGCAVQDVRDLLVVADTERDSLRADVIDRCLHAIAERVASFTLDAVDDRRRDGRLEFHDLLVLARRLLRHRPDALAAARERYRVLLLDEFQDTDPIQLELAALLASAGDPAGRPWDELAIEAGRLFVVGDAKQSIYRFRRADIALFLAARRALVDATTVLEQNFRSVPGIIAFVNDLFAGLMPEEVPEAQPAFQPLVAEREPLEGFDRPVVLLGGPHEGRRAGELRDLEAQEVAATICAAHTEGWPVVTYHPDGEATSHPARWSDFAVLLPARTSLPQLEAALGELAVPYRLETGSLVWSSREVRELLGLLAAVDDPADEVALVGALRSASLACGDDDLFTFRRAGGRWSHQRPGPVGALDPAHPVVVALERLAALHDRRFELDLSGMVDAVVREFRLLELAVAAERPRDVWRRLRWVLDQARAFAEAGGATAHDFLAWAELQQNEASRVSEPILPETDDDAVRVLTVHGAKGLEFPITVLSGMSTQLKGPGGGVQVIFGDEGQAPEVHLRKGVATAAFEVHKPIDEQLDRYERLRLLYVAATRARDHLVISCHHAAGKESYGSLVWNHADAFVDRWRAGLDDVGEVEPVVEAPGPVPRFTLDDRDAWIDRRRALVSSLGQAPVVAATAVTARLRPEAPGYPVDPLQAPEAGDPLALPDATETGGDGSARGARPTRRHGRGGTAFGKAVHATLQTVDLADASTVANIAEAQAGAEGIPGRSSEVGQRVRDAIDCPIVREAAAGEHWRELYVAAPVEGVLVEGFVDLLVRRPDGFVVVDYKTDTVPDEAAVAAAVERYRLQGAAYALVLERHLGQPVVEMVFVFLTPKGAVERRLDDLAAAVAEVRAGLAGDPV